MKPLFLILAFFPLAWAMASAPSAPKPQSNPSLPDFTMVNEDGKNFQLHDFKGKKLFVSFVYSRCPMPKMCPLTMQLNKRLFKLWKSSNSKVPLHFLIVSLDPEYDTPGVMKKFGQRHALDFKYFTLVTGNEKTLSDFASQFNAIGIPGEGMVSHNAKSILIGSDLVPIKEYKENEWTPEEVLNELLPAKNKS